MRKRDPVDEKNGRQWFVGGMIIFTLFWCIFYEDAGQEYPGTAFEDYDR